MKINYLIDGFNVGFKDNTIAERLHKGDTERAIDLTLLRIRQRVRKAGSIIVVFDGRKHVFNKPAGYSGIEIIFSKKPQSADDIIRQKLRNLSDPAVWLVVSSDHEIINTAKDLGARVLRSEEFLKTHPNSGSAESQTKNVEKYNPKDVNIDYWLEQFKRGNEE